MNGKEIASIFRAEVEEIRLAPYPPAVRAEMHNIKYTLLSLAEKFEAYDKKPTSV